MQTPSRVDPVVDQAAQTTSQNPTLRPSRATRQDAILASGQSRSPAAAAGSCGFRSDRYASATARWCCQLGRADGLAYKDCSGTPHGNPKREGACQMPVEQNRRRLLATLSSAAAAGVLGRTKAIAQEPALETTRIRLYDWASVCIAPQFVAEELLKSE